MIKVLLTGGSGTLGQSIKKNLPQNWDLYSPTSVELNITNLKSIDNIINEFNPKIVIHAAAYVDTMGCQYDINRAIDTNIIGTINMVKSCLNQDCKFVYISSEYVFGGDRGNYSVEDRLDPKNIYGKTKSASEYIVSILPNYQIIRAPFVRKIHTKAFIDQYSSKFFLNEATNHIIDAINNSELNIVHIASEKMSLYDLYKSVGYNIDPITMDDLCLKILPKDTSLINNI